MESKWKIYPFGDIVKNLDGKRKPIKSDARQKGSYAYYGASGIIDYVEDYIFEGENLLVSEDGANLTMRTYPIAFIATGKYWVNNHAHVVTAKEGLTTNKFLEYFFASKDIAEYVTGAAQPKLSQKKLNEIPVPLPSLPEQQRIVAKLDALFERIDRAIALVAENIENTKHLMASVLNDVFENRENNDWIESSLYAEFDVRDGTHDSPQYLEKEKGHPFVTSKNLKETGLDLTDVKYISESNYIDYNRRSKVHKGDLLFAMIGTIGNPTIVNIEPNFAIKNVALIKPRDKKHSIDFLRYYLLSTAVIRKMRDEANGATQKFVGLNYLRNFPFYYPSIEKEKKIVDHLNKVSQQQQTLLQSQHLRMAELKQLKSSLLNSAFRGEL